MNQAMRHGEGIMSYVIKANLTDLAGIVDMAAIAGGIWVPPPANGSNPGAANNAASVSSGPEGTTLTFPGLDGPPQSSAVWVSIPPGDLFRSGAVGPLPASPAPLTLFTIPGQVPPAHAITQTDIDNMVTGLLFTSLPIPDDVQSTVSGKTGGLWVPTSITLSSLTVALPQSSASGTLGVNVSGRIAARGWFWSESNTFTLAVTLGVIPSADPVDRTRILAVTVSSSPGPSLAVSRVPGWMSKWLAPWAASAVASMLEGLVNQAVVSIISDKLAHLSSPFEPSMLTPTAVVSMGRLSVLPAGIDLAIAIGDIFGPGIIPIAGNVTSVPNVIHDDLPTAAKAVGVAGLIFEGQWDNKYSGLYDVPTVVATDPPARTPVQKGTYVTCIYVKPDISQ